MVNFRLLFGVLGSRRRHLKPNHLSPPSQSQHLANSHQPRTRNTTITLCPILYNPAPFPNKAELSGELLLCVAPFLSLGFRWHRRELRTPKRSRKFAILLVGALHSPLSPLWGCGRCFLSGCFLLNRGGEGSEGLRIGRRGLIGLPTVRMSRCGLLQVGNQ